MNEQLLKLKFDKKRLFSLLVVRANSVLENRGYSITMKELDWFTANVDYAARRVEAILLPIIATPIQYTTDSIDYQFVVTHPLQCVVIGDNIERYIVEYLFEMMSIQRGMNSLGLSNELYIEIKSAALK